MQNEFLTNFNLLCFNVITLQYCYLFHFIRKSEIEATYKQVHAVQRYSVGESSLSIIPLYFAYFCDDDCMAETCCTIKQKRVFLKYIIRVCFYSLTTQF
jgi:hypothetical protein